MAKKFTRVIEIDHLGYMIEEKRKALGLTQTELAEKIEATRVTVSNMEGGRHRPTFEKLEKLCEVFGCTATDLLGF